MGQAQDLRRLGVSLSQIELPGQAPSIKVVVTFQSMSESGRNFCGTVPQVAMTSLRETGSLRSGWHRAWAEQRQFQPARRVSATGTEDTGGERGPS